MTTAEQRTAVATASSVAGLRRLAWPADWRRQLSLVAGITAALLGSQTLAASTPMRSDVRLLLPSEGLLAGLGDGLRRGYSVAMEETRSCGLQPPSLQVGWLPPGADPQAPVGAAPRSHLLVAPPAAPLPAYGLLAEQQRLSVLLPLQRGVSLDGLPQLRGSDRLWPLMPGRSLEADRLAQALLAEGIKRVMVVRDRSAESKALTDRFVASFANGKGDVIGPTAAPISVPGDDPAAMVQLVSDVDWTRPPALVVITQPGSALAQAVRAANWPETLLLAWSAPVEQPLAVEQIGVHPLSRGPGWTSFAQRFEQRWGYKPGVVESAGYDSGLMSALASVQAGGRNGWDLQWFSANAKPQPLCTALKLRAEGAKVRPQAASSQFDLSPAVPPSAQLQLSRG
ncbi:ABC transporter substrate-binding protein [Vulcanococcus sp. Clear-D1]|uniref:ABC transporter substrate-binding protein n=1 Tax=Vulcanococcus sp. Clear-D1 TaxID=2766970 RepID=UPI00199CC4A9|nr:ABC transporter substrate-binding protein [Vulcanococcus sp. Clear-D1]MBD1195226.1 ABC transporter substrate-binding protein [Vulcanococcus sp. Clear-D1]